LMTLQLAGYVTIKAKVVIPMHFKTPKCAYPIAGVDDSLRVRKM